MYVSANYFSVIPFDMDPRNELKLALVGYGGQSGSDLTLGNSIRLKFYEDA